MAEEVAGTTCVDEHGAVVGGDDAYAQASETLRKVIAAVEAASARPDHVVQTRIFLRDLADWAEVGRAHGEVFADVEPAAAMLVTTCSTSACASRSRPLHAWVTNGLTEGALSTGHALEPPSWRTSVPAPPTRS